MRTTTNHGMNSGGAVLVAFLAAMLSPTAGQLAHADVLYDTTSITDNHTYNFFVPSQIAAIGPGSPNTLGDMNAADDFSLSSMTTLTSVTGDFISTAAFGGSGVLVEFFADNGGSPSASPTQAFFATLGNGLSVDAISVTGVTGMRFTIDLTGADISLGAGTWWMSMVVVDDVTPSQIYRWVGSTTMQTGGELHVRDGGIAHANGLQGTWGFTDWTPISAFGNTPGDVAMRIEGFSIPAPGAFALFGLAGICQRRRRQ